MATPLQLRKEADVQRKAAESQVKSAVVLGVAVASLDPASEAKSKLIKWYEDYLQGDGKDFHDRSRWKMEWVGIGIIWIITLINFTTEIGNGPKDWLSLGISFFLEFVFLIGSLFAGWMDKKYCKHHEMALWGGCGGIIQILCVYALLWCAFGAGVSAVFQTLADGIDIFFMLMIGIALAVLVTVVYIPLTPKHAPTWGECWDAEMQKKYDLRKDPKTGKPTSRLRYLWRNRAKMVRNIGSDVICLGMFRPSRAATFAKCGFFYMFFDLFLVLCGSGWFLMRIFAVSIVLSVGGGVGHLVKQAKFCYDQRKRICGLDYGAFDPPKVKAIKLMLNAKFNIPNFDPNLPMPKLSLPDLLVLLPGLPDTPGFDLPALQVSFPEVPGIDSFSNPFSLPDVNLGSCCGDMNLILCDSIEEVFGAILAILFSIAEVSILTDMALDAKDEKLKLAGAGSGDNSDRDVELVEKASAA